MATDVIFHTAYTIYAQRNKSYKMEDLIKTHNEHPNGLIEYIKNNIPHFSENHAAEYKGKVYSLIESSIEPLWSNGIQYFVMKIGLASNLGQMGGVIQSGNTIFPLNEGSRMLVEFNFAYYFEKVEDSSQEIILHLIHLRRTNINVHEIFLHILKQYYNGFSVKPLSDIHSQAVDEIEQHIKKIDLIGRSTPSGCFNFGGITEEDKGLLRLSITHKDSKKLFHKVINFIGNNKTLPHVMEIESANVTIEKNGQQKTIPVTDLDHFREDLIVNLKKDRIMYGPYIPPGVFREQANSFKKSEESGGAIKTLLGQHYLPNS